MGWGGYGDRKAGGNQGYVMEGQVPIYTFTETPTRVRFLTEDVDVERVMSEKGIVREEAEDFIATKLSQERWLMPVARWEHTIKEIPGKRFFSTVVCPGRGVCFLCAENDKDKENGVSENKLLSYPVRKRFFVPAYVYDMNRVLFIRGAEDFFDDVATYINKHGSNCDFEVFKTGRGFNTKYKVVFTGAETANLDVDASRVLAPKDLDFMLDTEEWRRRIEGGPGARAPGPRIDASRPAGSVEPIGREAASGAPVKVDSGAAAKAPKSKPGDFALPFGSHKGRTLKQLYDLGEEEYVTFLATQGAGLVQERAKAFLEEVKK
jgi:hypothetical protein